ncbi:MAG TPA: class I SAM-dependent methyltransferase [Dongiaceae bacterium]|jgi:SAM-dependent methyltransferase|nr:class I SAM-dependent methyltransferase [Dongiaceae bacterium]
MPMERVASGAMRTDAEVGRAWDENAEQWVRQVRAGWDRYREDFNNPMFLAFLPELAGRTVIDLGCGEGRNTREFARRGARLTGIDVSANMIEAAIAAEAQEPLGISYRVLSFSDLRAYTDDSFDLALSTMALMDGPDFAGAAREAYRVLRPGGGFYFSVLHPCFVTPMQKWILNEAGQEIGFRVGEYFSDDVHIDRWRFKAAPEESGELFAIPRFPHRMETYINGLAGAGFRILKMQEPRPSEDMVATLPRLARLRRHIPIFIYFAAEKPGNQQ